MKMKLLVKLLIFVVLAGMLAFLPITVFAKSTNPQSGGTNGTKFINNDVYTLSSGQTLNGTLFAVNSTITLSDNSTVNGTVVILGGNISAAGTIQGSMICLDCSGKILDTAVINGSVVNPSNLLDISAKASISGSTVSGGVPSPGSTSAPNSTQPSNQSDINLVSRILGGIFVVLSLSAVGVLVVLLFPKATERVSHATIANPGIAWGVGILSVVVVFVGMIILTITILLIPVAALAGLLLGIAVIFGWVAVGHEIGTRIAASSNQKWVGPVAAGVGLLVMNVIVVGFVMIPSWVGSCISSILIFVVSMFGLGAVILTRFGSHIYPEPLVLQQTPVAPPLPATPLTPGTPVNPQPAPGQTVPFISEKPGDETAPVKKPTTKTK